MNLLQTSQFYIKFRLICPLLLVIALYKSDSKLGIVDEISWVQRSLTLAGNQTFSKPMPAEMGLF